MGEDALHAFTVDAAGASQRADVYVSSVLEDVTRSYCKKLFTDGRVVVNGEAVKASAVLKEGDVVKVTVPAPVTLDAVPEDIPLDILYEDDDVLVVNKGKGMVVHPSPGHERGTLVNAVLFHCGSSLSGVNGVLRPGIVHRIDMDTTGSVLVCKNDAAHQALALQLKQHSIGRVYHAIVHGVIEANSGTIETRIGRSATDRKKMAVLTGKDAARGKDAVTHYTVLKRFLEDNMTYVACRLQTGRTHQIRVHMTYLGHPILGDAVYGASKNTGKLLADLEKRMNEGEGVVHRVQADVSDGTGVYADQFTIQGQCLHAKELAFTHPVTKERILTDAPLPGYFARLLEVLR